MEPPGVDETKNGPFRHRIEGKSNIPFDTEVAILSEFAGASAILDHLVLSNFVNCFLIAAWAYGASFGQNQHPRNTFDFQA